MIGFMFLIRIVLCYHSDGDSLGLQTFPWSQFTVEVALIRDQYYHYPRVVGITCTKKK